MGGGGDLSWRQTSRFFSASLPEEVEVNDLDQAGQESTGGRPRWANRDPRQSRVLRVWTRLRGNRDGAIRQIWRSRVSGARRQNAAALHQRAGHRPQRRRATTAGRSVQEVGGRSRRVGSSDRAGGSRALTAGRVTAVMYGRSLAVPLSAVGSGADAVRVLDSGGETIVELVDGLDDEPMDPQLGRVGHDPREGWLVMLLHEIEEARQTVRPRRGAGESPHLALERDRRLRHRHLVRAAVRDQPLERLVQVANVCGSSSEVILHRPGHDVDATESPYRAAAIRYR